MAHDGTAVLLGRVRHPRDKAKVETAVLIVERFILTRLRNRRFVSLGELNEAIHSIQGDLNARLMRKLGASRREFFDSIDRPALMPLPGEPYAYAEWKRYRVAPDYHVELHGQFYSVPSRLIREMVEAGITDATIEVFHAGQRVAAHPRSALRRRHTTTPEHMPSAHRRYASWTPARIQSFAAEVGPGTAALVETIMSAKPPSRTPSRVSAPASASYSLRRPTGTAAWRRPASAASPSACAATARSPGSCATVSIGHSRTIQSPTPRPCCTKTSAAAAITT